MQVPPRKEPSSLIRRLRERLEPGSPRERIVIGVSLAAAGAVLILDQWTKLLVETAFRLHESRPVIDGFFALTYVRNLGAAWSILEGRGSLLLGIALLVLALMLIFFRRLAEGCVERYVAILLVGGGILGNSIDRLWRGAVVDFFDFTFGTYHYPIFNVADCAICVGVFLYLLSSFLRKPRQPETKDDENAETKKPA